MKPQLILSLFPGIGMLDMAFEEAGFCVVRGPDKLWGGDVKRFHPPRGRFNGVIGGDPCQGHSSLAHLNRAQGAAVEEDYTPEFERCVEEAQPDWFLRENSPFAPIPAPPGYIISDAIVCDHWVGGETSRRRRFCFGAKLRLPFQVETLALHRADPKRAVTGDARVASVGERVRLKDKAVDGGVLPRSGKTMSLDQMLWDQGLPADFFGEDCPFTLKACKQMIGNGVPLAMGRAVAAAVVNALQAAERAA